MNCFLFLFQLAIFSIFIQSVSSTSPLLSFRRDSRQYPSQNQVPDTNLTPKEWTDAFNAAKAAGKIPDFPQSSNSNGYITYPDNYGNDPEVCSWTTTKCLGKNDIHTAPKNVIGVQFDDGPTGASSDLYNFLNSNNQSSTHFLIGSNILNYPDDIKQADAEGNQQFAVHTWSHTLQTTLSNDQIIAELGWTMQIIYDMTDKIPSLWRPPQGDVDNRVRAIAENVFGLTTVLWNKDSNDWCIDYNGHSECPGQNPGQDDQSVANVIQGFIHDNINQSEGIIILEHELTSYSVNHFKNYYPQLSGLGWTPKSIPELDGRDWYANAVDGTSTTTNQTEMVFSSASQLNSSEIIISHTALPQPTSSQESTSQGNGTTTNVPASTSSITTSASLNSKQNQASSASTSSSPDIISLLILSFVSIYFLS